MSHRAFARLRLISIALFMFGLVSVAVAFNATTAQEAKQRVIARMPVEKNEPVEIAEVRVNGQPISFDKEFSADDNWLRSLTVSIKNRSNKTILFASIRLRFPRATGLEEAVSVHDMFWGDGSLQTQLPNREKQADSLKPGDSNDIKFSAQQFTDLMNFLRGTHYPFSIDHVDLSVAHVIFDDDSMWYVGTFLQRDPTDPSKWLNTERAKTR